LDYLVNYLGIKEPLNEKEKVFLTTDDRQFTIRTVACFGQCALSPICEIDGIIYSHMTNESVKVVIDQMKKDDLKGKKQEPKEA
jgi:NADH-quinone oxidoreductase subunit E